MAEASEEEASRGGVVHGFGDGDALFVIADEAAPARHGSERALDDPAACQHFEFGSGVNAADDIGHEIQERGLVHQGSTIVGAPGEEMLDPRPALAHGVEDRFGAGAVGDICRVQVEHQKAAIRPRVSRVHIRSVNHDGCFRGTPFLKPTPTTSYANRSQRAFEERIRGLCVVPDPLKYKKIPTNRVAGIRYILEDHFRLFSTVC